MEFLMEVKGNNIDVNPAVGTEGLHSLGYTD